jgi:Bromodomain
MSSGNKVKVVGDDNNQDTVGNRRETTTATTKSTMSHSQEEAMIRTVRIVEQFLARTDSYPFREPVDWEGLELYDYPEIVKRMMDLGTIKDTIDAGGYTCAAEVAYDVRQIWKNCMLYNAENSEFFVLAKQFSKRFEDRYRRIRSECK